MHTETVGIVGAGQMGRGIAQVFAHSGFNVVLHDISGDALEDAAIFIERQFSRDVSKGRTTSEKSRDAFARIATTTDLAQAANVDLVVEAATELEDIKVKLLRDIVPSVKSNTILATNTSSISVTRLASCTDRPDRFIGLHFMNPVPKMDLVEVIRGVHTSDATNTEMDDVVSALGKTSVNAADFPAFITNRVLIPMINEAIYALFEGVGTVPDIDKSLRLGAGHPMGPLELADFIGLDTCLSIMNVLNDGLADPKYRPCPLLTKYVDANWLGRKTKRGFYDYSSTEPVPSVV